MGFSLRFATGCTIKFGMSEKWIEKHYTDILNERRSDGSHTKRCARLRAHLRQLVTKRRGKYTATKRDGTLTKKAERLQKKEPIFLSASRLKKHLEQQYIWEWLIRCYVKHSEARVRRKATRNVDEPLE